MPVFRQIRAALLPCKLRRRRGAVTCMAEDGFYRMRIYCNLKMQHKNPLSNHGEWPPKRKSRSERVGGQDGDTMWETCILYLQLKAGFFESALLFAGKRGR